MIYQNVIDNKIMLLFRYLLLNTSEAIRRPVYRLSQFNKITALLKENGFSGFK